MMTSQMHRTRASTQSSTSLNASALAAFNQQLNSDANVRDFLMPFTHTLLITTANSIKMQASSLSQLTDATDQLTRSASVSTFYPHSFTYIPISLEKMLASDKCYQLASALHSMATEEPYEDVQSAATSIAQCATNTLTVSDTAKGSEKHRRVES